MEFLQKRPALAIWLLMCTSILIYWPALQGSYIWDDVAFVATNPLLNSNHGLYQLWFSRAQVDYWPLTYSTFWMERQVFGLNPFVSHVINALLHGLNGVLVWQIMRRLGLRGAWLAGLLFLVHPVTVDAVANIFQRKTVLAGSLYFAALLCYLIYDERPLKRWLAGSLLFFTLAVLSKSSALMLPPTILVLLAWRHKGWPRQHLWPLLPFFVVSLVLGMVGLQFQQQHMLAEGYSPGGWIERISNAGHIIFFYLQKAFWPVDLVFVYPRWEVMADAGAFIPDALVLIFLAAAWVFRGTWGAGILALTSIYLLNLFPVLGAVDIVYFRFSWVADRFQYISLAALICAVVHGVSVLISTSPLRLRLPIAASLATVVVVPLAVLSWDQASVFQNEERVWQRVVERYPDSWLGHLNLGVYLSSNKRFDEGFDHMLLAHTLRSDEPLIDFNLGKIAEQSGRPREAEQYYEEALQQDPAFFMAGNNLGRLLAARGHSAQAERIYRTALDNEPNAPSILNNLGQLLLSQNRLEASERMLRAALNEQPDLIEAQVNLAAVLVRTKRFQGALDQIDIAMEKRPDLAEVHYLRGLALLGLRRDAEAEGEFKEALRLKPGWSPAIRALAR